MQTTYFRQIAAGDQAHGTSLHAGQYCTTSPLSPCGHVVVKGAQNAGLDNAGADIDGLENDWHEIGFKQDLTAIDSLLQT